MDDDDDIADRRKPSYEVVVCAGLPNCPFEGDDAIEAANDGCPLCMHVICDAQGIEIRHYRIKAH